MRRATIGSQQRDHRPGRQSSRLGLEQLEMRVVLSTFVVQTNLDTDASEIASLRTAILRSNASSDPAPNQIQFKIGTGFQSIFLNSALPPITHAVTIDGLTQPGANGSPSIMLVPNPKLTPFTGDGLTVYAGSSTIRGLVISGFTGNGIVLARNGGDLIENCIIGGDGQVGSGNTGTGILLKAVPGNVIQNNVIASNGTGDGVLISSDGTTPPLTHVVSTTTTDTLNGPALVDYTFFDTGSGTAVQGTFVLEDTNPAFSFPKIVGSFQAPASQIIGNFPLFQGTMMFPANGSLVATSLTDTVTAPQSIGTVTGQLDSRGNLTLEFIFDSPLSGQGITGSYRTKAELLATNVPVTGTTKPIAGTVVATWVTTLLRDVVESPVPNPQNPTGNLIANNFIGTDRAGAAALGNQRGIKVDGALSSSNIVRGNLVRFNTLDGIDINHGASQNAVDAGNTISDNGQIGVQILGGSGNTVTGNTLHSNGTDGVTLSGGTGTVVAGNTISNNRNVGVQISGKSRGNAILSNTIDASSENGIRLNGSSGNHIFGNTIIRSGSSGVQVVGDPLLAGLPGSLSANLIDQNLIGTNAGGTAGLGNGIGVELVGGGPISSVLRGNIVRFNQTDGVFIHSGSSNNHVDFLNVISDNAIVGIQIYQATANVIEGNTIASNGSDGVFLNAASGNTLSGNFITRNVGVGVQILGPDGGNLIQINAIIANATDGVFLNSTVGNTVIANTITNQQGVGVHLLGSTQATPASNNHVVGNAISHNLDGIAFDGWSSSNVVGGVATPGGSPQLNTIQNNRRSGINIVGNGATSNIIQSNVVRHNNGFDLVMQRMASNNVIGGPGGAGNQLSSPLALYSGARSFNRIVQNIAASTSTGPARKFGPKLAPGRSKSAHP